MPNGAFSTFSAPPLFPEQHYSKCRPSRPVHMDRLHTSGMFSPISNSSDIIGDIRWSSEYVFLTVIIHSPRPSATLSLNAPLGQLRFLSPNDQIFFEDATAITASQVANNMLSTLALTICFLMIIFRSVHYLLLNPLPMLGQRILCLQVIMT